MPTEHQARPKKSRIFGKTYFEWSIIPEVFCTISSMYYFFFQENINVTLTFAVWRKRETTERLVYAFVFSRIDLYYNSHLHGLPNKQLDKLQRVQNTARASNKPPKFSHITPTLWTLHWLPIKFRIQFKNTLFTFKALHDLAHRYLSNLLVIKNGAYNLRSSKQLLSAMISTIA